MRLFSRVIQHAAILAMTPLAVTAAEVSSARTISQLKAFVESTPIQMARFDLSAKVILETSPQDNVFFATDGTNAIKLVDNTDRPKRKIIRNSRVHLQGRVDKTGAPICAVVDPIAPAAAEPLVELSISELLRTCRSTQAVCVRGTVRSAFRDEIDPKWAFITLSDSESLLHVAFMPAASEFQDMKKLVDADVRIHGVLESCNANPLSNRKFMTTLLYIRSLADISVIRPAPEDPYDVPPFEKSQLPADTSLLGVKHSVCGHVLASYGGNRLVLCNNLDEIINVELSENAQIPFGSPVEIVGRPATDLYRVTFTDAIWRKTQDPVKPRDPPTNIRLSDLLTDGHGQTMIKPAYHGHTIRVHGIVRTLADAGIASNRMMIECDHSMIAVDLNQCPSVLNELKPGSEVEVSGICVMTTDNWHPRTSMPRIREVFIALRTADDLTILRRPPWWTPIRFLGLIAILVSVLSVILIWNRILKRTVERRSRELLDEQIAHVTSDLKTMERTRLAIELHDSLAQNLTGVALQLQTARETIRSDIDTAATHLETADRSLLSCRAELRNCLRDLRSEALETDDVNEAIRMTLVPHTGDTAITIRFNVPRERLTDNTLHTVLRIIRELVLNAIRHGLATSVKVAGTIENGRLLFSVYDNGCGFDPTNRPGPRDGHFGLQGIRERINDFNGTFELDSKPGLGTKATLTLLLPQGTTS